MMPRLLLVLGTLLSLTSCMYRMPTDDDICNVPLINNPEITGDPGSSLFPSSAGI